jgi:hypothetical protein
VSRRRGGRRQLGVVDRHVEGGAAGEGDGQAGLALVGEDDLEGPVGVGRDEQQTGVGLGPLLRDGGDVELDGLAALGGLADGTGIRASLPSVGASWNGSPSASPKPRGPPGRP